MSSANALVVASKASASTSRKRGRDEDSNSPSPQPDKPKKKRKPESSKQRRVRRSLTKMNKKEVPEDAKDLKRALELHISLLSGAHSQEAIMPSPSPITLARFEERFHDRDAVFAARLGPSLLEKSAMLQVAALRSGNGAGGVIASDISRIEDHHLQTIILQLSRYGLSTWCPNFDESPYSVYNQAMRTIALDSFKQAAASHAYLFLDAALPVGDNGLLVRIYDNYVHSYHFSKWKKEHKEPGSVAAGILSNIMYKRRVDLARKRGEFLRSSGYPLRVVRLVEDPACASDDEEEVVKGQTVWRVKSKPFRSERLNALVEWIDEQRLVVLRGDGQRRKGAKERKRIRDEEPQEGITTLPLNAPIDFFSPKTYNELPISIRARYAVKPLIALPADDDLFAGPQAGTWKTLSDDDFMEAHGNEILKNYVLPTKDEIKAALKNSKKRTKIPQLDDEDEQESFAKALDKETQARKKTGVAPSSKKTLDDERMSDDDDE